MKKIETIADRQVLKMTANEDNVTFSAITEVQDMQENVIIHPWESKYSLRRSTTGMFSKSPKSNEQSDFFIVRFSSSSLLYMQKCTLLNHILPYNYELSV